MCPGQKEEVHESVCEESELSLLTRQKGGQVAERGAREGMI